MNITIKGIKDEDFVNYKKCSMFIIWPSCTFKCDKENKCQLCQNMPLIHEPDITITAHEIVERYLANPLSKAIVMGGLEPFDSFGELQGLIAEFRLYTEDDIVIYTGYEEYEVMEQVGAIEHYPNIIVKYGRFRPNQRPHLDEELGVELASDNQYATKISIQRILTI